METEPFDLEVLEDIRNSIIQILGYENYTIPEHYKLAEAKDDRTSFKVTLCNGTKYLTITQRIRKGFIRPPDASDKTAYALFDFEKEYQRRLKLKE